MSETAGDRPTDDRSGHRKPAWLPLGAAALIVPTALAGLTLAWPRPQIESDLTQRATEALSAAGIPAAGVAFSGRDATISGVPADQRAKALAVVQDATGVRVAAFPEPGPGGGAGNGSGGGAAAAAPFGIQETGDAIVLTGVVGSEEERTQLVSAAAAQAGGKSVEDRLTVTPGATLPAGVTAASVTALAGALASANGDASVSITPDGVTLTGSVPDDATKTAIGEKAMAALAGATVDNQLTVAGAGAGSGNASAAGDELDATAKQALQGQINQLVAGAPITFGPDSPQLTPEGSATVARVLDLLKAAPGVRIQVDGYVASGPGNGKLSAQQLSDQRAAAVRATLVAGGVPVDRIAARGLGEGTMPAQSTAGRRVEITVV